MRKTNTRPPKIGKSQFGGYYIVDLSRYQGKLLTQEQMKELYEKQKEEIK